MTDDLVARLKAGLDADEARANAMSHFTVHEQPYYSCAGARTGPVGDLEWGEEYCDCFLAERKARALGDVAFKRAILAMHMPQPFWGNNPLPPKGRTPENVVAWYCQCQCPDGVIQGTYPCETVLALAAVYGDAREVNRG